MKDNKLVEKYDDNPGAYFGMLVEDWEDKEKSRKKDNLSEGRGKNKYKLKIDGKTFPSSYGIAQIEGAFYNNPVKNIIRKLDDDHTDDRFDYGWEDNDDIGDEFHIYANRWGNEKADSGNVIKLDSEYIYDVEDLYNYMKKAFSMVNNGEVEYVQVVTPRGNTLVEYGKPELFESLKEDKFVSRDKMSKKDKKELDSQKRNTWGNTNPVTRVQPNKKAYDRKRDKKIEDESLEENFNIELKDYKKDEDVQDGYTFNFMVNGHLVTVNCWTDDWGGYDKDLLLDFDDYSQVDFLSEKDVEELWEKLGDIIESKISKNESLKESKLNESNEHILSKENSDKVKDIMESFQDLLGSFSLMYKDFDVPYDVALQYYKEIKDLNNQLYSAFIHDDNYPDEEDLSSYGIEYGYYN